MIRQIYECKGCGSRFFRDRRIKDLTMVTEIHTCRDIRNFNGSIFWLQQSRAELIGEQNLETFNPETQ